MNRPPPARPSQQFATHFGQTPPAWFEFLDYVDRLAQRGRFAAEAPAPWQDTQDTWADTRPQQPPQLGLEVTEHGADDAVTREVFALLAQRSCPPCNGDCLQGDDCSALEARQRRAERARIEAQSIEARHPWLWAVYAAVIGATLWLCTQWPWGFALGFGPGAGQ